MKRFQKLKHLYLEKSAFNDASNELILISFSLFKFIPNWKSNLERFPLQQAYLVLTHLFMRNYRSLKSLPLRTRAQTVLWQIVANTILRKVNSGTYRKVLTQPFFTIHSIFCPQIHSSLQWQVVEKSHRYYTIILGFLRTSRPKVAVRW